VQKGVGKQVTLVDSAEVTAEMVSRTFAPAPGHFVQGRVTHFVTGDPLAFDHTARVIGGVDGEIVQLPVTELAEIRARKGESDRAVHAAPSFRTPILE
jgi:hypothetical protein